MTVGVFSLQSSYEDCLRSTRVRAKGASAILDCGSK